MSTQNHRIDRGPLSTRGLSELKNKSPLYYGFGALGFNLFIEVFGGYAYFYYIEILGLAMTLTAIVRLIFTIWDSVNDPIFGYLSDNTRSRWGRRHFWLLPATLMSGFVFVLVFSAPNFVLENNRLFWYMLVILLIYETLTTILTINYLALFPEYFPPGKERSRASIYNQAAKTIAVLLGLAVTPLVYKAVGFTLMATIYSILGVVLLVMSLIRNREDPVMQTMDQVSIIPAFKNVLKERHFWLYGITISLASFGVNMVPFALPFYVKYVLSADVGTTSLLSGIALLTSLIVLPVWGRFLRKWKMQHIFTITLLIMSCGAVLLSLSGNLVIAIAGITLFGIGWSGIWVCHLILRADLVTKNLVETGKNTEALYYALINVIQRAGGLLQSLAMLLAATFFGYISGSDPGPHPDRAFRFLMGLAPFIGFIFAWLFSRSFFKRFSTDFPAYEK